MRCPACRHLDTRVNDSRVASDGLSIRRRRECARCGFRFSTSESLEIMDLTVVKRDGRKESYDREKLVHGLRRALEKRPYTTEGFRELVNRIELDIQKKRRVELTSREIGELVMNRLRHFDQVAYIRFASVYRSFEDAATFQQALASLVSTSRQRRSLQLTLGAPRLPLKPSPRGAQAKGRQPKRRIEGCRKRKQ